MGSRSSVHGVVGALVALYGKKHPKKRVKFDDWRSIRAVLSVLDELGVSYSIVNESIIPVFKSKEDAEACREALRARGIKVP